MERPNHLKPKDVIIRGIAGLVVGATAIGASQEINRLRSIDVEVWKYQSSPTVLSLYIENDQNQTTHIEVVGPYWNSFRNFGVIDISSVCTQEQTRCP